mgnify:CR=1 FL=1
MLRFMSSRKMLLRVLLGVTVLISGSGAAYFVESWHNSKQAERFAALSRPLVDKLAKELDVSYVDAARVFVHRHTDHDMESDWYHRHADDQAYVLEQLYKTAANLPSAERPDLACGWRVLAMKNLLKAAGIRADTLYLYNDTGADPNQNSHVVLEVSNNATNRLEVHDVDFNIKYLTADGETASLSDLMKADVNSDFSVCDETGCGTERIVRTTVALNDYYKSAYYRDRDVFVLSRSKFDVAKQFTIHRLRGDEVMDVYEYFNYIYPGAPIVEF